MKQRSKVIANLWNRVIWLIVQTDVEKTKVDCIHILYALIFLKVYSLEEVLFIDKINDIKENILIVLDNQFDGLDGIADTNCFMCLNETHWCSIFEP